MARSKQRNQFSIPLKSSSQQALSFDSVKENEKQRKRVESIDSSDDAHCTALTQHGWFKHTGNFIYNNNGKSVLSGLITGEIKATLI